MLALITLSTSGFTLPSVGVPQAQVSVHRAAVSAMSEDMRGKQRKSSDNFASEETGAWSSLDKFNGEPETLYEQVMWKGPGMGLMYYMPDLKAAWSKVAGSIDVYLSVEDMGVLAANTGGPDAEEMCATIEKEQGMVSSVFYFEQWTKWINDVARAEKGKK